jgi:hypothetical protein
MWCPWVARRMYGAPTTRRRPLHGLPTPTQRWSLVVVEDEPHVHLPHFRPSSTDGVISLAAGIRGRHQHELIRSDRGQLIEATRECDVAQARGQVDDFGHSGVEGFQVGHRGDLQLEAGLRHRVCRSFPGLREK